MGLGDTKRVTASGPGRDSSRNTEHQAHKYQQRLPFSIPARPTRFHAIEYRHNGGNRISVGYKYISPKRHEVILGSCNVICCWNVWTEVKLVDRWEFISNERRLSL